MTRFCFIVFLIILFAVGCGEKATEKAIEKKIEESTGSDAKVDLSDKGMKVSGETEKGNFSFTTGESVEIPEDFPADVFIYSPSKTMMAMKMPEGHSLSLSTENDVKKVTQTYQQEMKAKGWSEETSMNMGNQSVLMYKKENRVANIAIAEGDDNTQITVTVATE